MPTPVMTQPITMAPAPAPTAMLCGKPKMPLPMIEPTTRATSSPSPSLPFTAATGTVWAGLGGPIPGIAATAAIGLRGMVATSGRSLQVASSAFAPSTSVRQRTHAQRGRRKHLITLSARAEPSGHQHRSPFEAAATHIRQGQDGLLRRVARVLQCQRSEVTDRCEEDGCIQLLRRHFIGTTGPGDAETAREVLCRLVSRPGEGELRAPRMTGRK
jgi:hypothetical protein